MLLSLLTTIEKNDFIENYKTEQVYGKYLQRIKDVNPSFKSRKTIKKYLKAAIASQLYGDEGFYRIIQSNDKMLQKVLELESSN